MATPPANAQWGDAQQRPSVLHVSPTSWQCDPGPLCVRADTAERSVGDARLRAASAMTPRLLD